MIPDLKLKKQKKERAALLHACWLAFCDVFLKNKQSFLFDYGDKPILTRAVLNNIKREFCDNPNLDNNKKFFEKLEEQSKNFSTEAKICFMHIYFLHVLIISKPRVGKQGGMKPDTKKERLLFFQEDTGPLSGAFLSKFEKVFESGVCNPGNLYNASPFVNCRFIVSMLLDEKLYEEQDNYAAIIEKYCTANETASKAYGISSALRFYAMPEKYQTIISREAKDGIVKSFQKSLNIRLNDEQTRDEKLLSIKKQLEEDNPDDIVDFYYSPYKEQWKGTSTVKEPKGNYHPDSQQGEEDTNQSTPLNQILFGPPGTGKTYNAISLAVAIATGTNLAFWKTNEKERFKEFNARKKSGQIQMVTFHQNYAYEDFIEGIKPKLDDANNNLSYETKDGIFKKLANAAGKKPEDNHVLIIDEINRGNISKIFGELITLIEDTKREGMPEGLKLMLPYSRGEFGVPNNLYIIGTMNTADRSIALLDTALRRRFEFTEMMPDPDELEKINIEGISLPKLLNAMNKRITVLLDREHQIGHSFFLKVEDIEGLTNTFQKKILPLLQEYFFDDWETIMKVLNHNGFITRKKTKHGFIYGVLPHDDESDLWNKASSYTAIIKAKNESKDQND